MMAGAPFAEAVFAELGPRIEKLRDSGHTPGLATLLIGDDEPSARYVGMKMRKAEELGCHSPHVHLPQDAATADAIAAVEQLNADPSVDAMLVRSEEHTSELQSLMRISYAVFCLKKKIH